MFKKMSRLKAGAGEKNTRSRSKTDRLRNTGLEKAEAAVLRILIRMDPELLPESGNIPVVPDPAKNERVEK